MVVEYVYTTGDSYESENDAQSKSHDGSIVDPLIMAAFDAVPRIGTMGQ